MFKITTEQVQALLNYLATKPYAEVHQGVQMLQTLPKIEESVESADGFETKEI